MQDTNGGNAGFPPEVLSQLDELIQLGRASPLEATAAARQFFDQQSDELWQKLGNAAGEAQRAIADLATGGCVALTECYVRRVRQLSEELAGSEASPLERLLCENVAVNWLAAAEADRTATLSIEKTAGRIECLERRRSHAHRRYHQAIHSLATVRKLLRPTPHPIKVASTFQRPSARRSDAADRRRVPTPEGEAVNN